MSGPCFSTSVGGHPLRPPTRRRLGRPLPYQLADGTQVPPEANKSFRHGILKPMTTWGISSSFELLSPTSGQVTNALLTRSPLGNQVRILGSSFDLHVLGTPPAFILSQDQTLRIFTYLLVREFWNDWLIRLLLAVTIQLLRCRAFSTKLANSTSLPLGCQAY